jgi:hypothetical protein
VEKKPLTPQPTEQKTRLKPKKQPSPQAKKFAIANSHNHANKPSNKAEVDNLKTPKQTTALTSKKNWLMLNKGLYFYDSKFFSESSFVLKP